MDSIATIAMAGAFMAGLGVLLAAVLAYANRRLHVEEDPRIDAVEQMLPKSNCGACGSIGCRPFAEGLVAGDKAPGLCTVAPPGQIEIIAQFLHVDAGHVEKQVARLACSGGSHVSHMRAQYQGMQTCRAASLVSGGGKGCAWGCLGLGDCESVCDFDAIGMNRFGLPVVDEDKCTACNDCVEVCPKSLFSLQPISHQLWIACKNRDPGPEGEAQCDVVCNACGRCVADAPEGLIRIENNLAIIDYGKNELASRIPIERCPTGAIVWLDKDKGAVKGAGARRVTRKEPLSRVRFSTRLQP